MKEFTIEEKAQRYDEAIKKAKYYYDKGKTPEFANYIVSDIFPELKESEDEKIRKEIVSYIKSSGAVTNKQWIAWLEKQSEQKPIIEMKSPEESLGIDSDTYNKIVDECIYGEQKPTDNVEPKFKVGQTIKKEGFNSGFPIVKIENGFYYNDMGDNFPFTDQDSWELVEQKPADWSEEDEDMRDTIIRDLKRLGGDIVNVKPAYKAEIDWLKSLKERYTWKPSDEQIKALERECMAHSNYDLCRLCEQLKKLREE